jgi:signal transduction histidine kinase/PAS domain-containing protein
MFTQNDTNSWALNVVLMTMKACLIILTLTATGEIIIQGRMFLGVILTYSFCLYLVFVILLIHSTKNYTYLTAISLILAALLVTFRSVHSGELSSPFMVYLPLIPILGLYTLPKRTSAIVLAFTYFSLIMIMKYQDLFGPVSSEIITYDRLSLGLHCASSISIAAYFSYVYATKTHKLHSDLYTEREFLESLNTNVPGLIYRAESSKSSGLKITYMNKKVFALTGESSARYMNQDIINWRENIMLEDLSRVIEKQRDSLLKKSDYEITYRIKNSSSDILFLREKGSVFYDKSKELTIVDAIVMDMTHKIKLEEEVERQFLEIMQNKNKLELALEGSNLGTWEWDVINDKVHYDFRWLQMVGLDLTPEFSNLALWSGLLHPQDTDRCNTEIKKIIDGHKNSIDLTFRLKHKDGHYVYIKSRGVVAEKKSDGQVSKIIGTHLDISEVELAKINIEQSREQLFAMIKLLPVAVCMLDRDMNYLANSIAWKNLIIDNTTLFDFVNFRDDSRDFYKCFEEGITNALAGNVTKNPEHHIVFDDLKNKYFEWEFRPWLSEDGVVAGVLLLITDITERKEYDKLVGQSARMSALGEMAGGIAHEINNPLSIIGGYATVIKNKIDKKEFDKAKVYLGKVENTVYRIAKIVKGMKNFSRDGSSDPFEAIASNELLTETLELCSERFRNNDVKLLVEINCDSFIRCRSVEISQVLLNIINNAFQAVFQNEDKWVKVQLEHDTKFVYYIITDSGKGIAKEVIGRIFEPFFTTKAVGAGTGLGLSIAKGIIEDHGGELYYDFKSPNTNFVVKLPKLSKTT